MLMNAPTNRRPYANGKEVYEAYVEPARVDLHRVGAHFALSRCLRSFGRETGYLLLHSATIEDFEHVEAGVQVLTTNRARIRSNITLEEYAVDSEFCISGTIFCSPRFRAACPTNSSIGSPGTGPGLQEGRQQ
jgi:hypothetical protein